MESDSPDILKKIVRSEQEDLHNRRTSVPIQVLEQRIKSCVNSQPRNLAGTLMGDSVRIIAEIKRATPSKGILLQNLDPTQLAKTYAENGAAAISVLTNEPFFQGSLHDMEMVHKTLKSTPIPILRKDFIFDPYQVCEARAYGADSVLLIVSMLSSSQLLELMNVAQQFWIQCLVEVHDEDELEMAIKSGAEIIGINNRNLHTFQTDLSVTERLAPRVPSDCIVVSESGIKTRDDILRVVESGANAILVGEALVTSKDPGNKLREMM